MPSGVERGMTSVDDQSLHLVSQLRPLCCPESLADSIRLVSFETVRSVISGPRPDRQGRKALWRIDFHMDLAPRAVFGCIRRSIAQEVLIFELERDPCIEAGSIEKDSPIRVTTGQLTVFIVAPGLYRFSE